MEGRICSRSGYIEGTMSDFLVDVRSVLDGGVKVVVVFLRNCIRTRLGDQAMT